MENLSKLLLALVLALGLYLYIGWSVRYNHYLDNCKPNHIEKTCTMESYE